MGRWLPRFGWMALGVAALYAAAAMAGAVSGGPLDPPYGPTAGTMRSLEQIPPAWFSILPSDDGAPCANSRFTCVMGGDAVVDRETGLVWERQPSACQASCAWVNNFTRCLKSETGGRKGWRLPSIDEIQTLVDPATDTLPANHPFTLPDGSYYAINTDPQTPGYAMIMDVIAGQMIPSAMSKADPGTSWCVRGGRSDALLAP